MKTIKLAFFFTVVMLAMTTGGIAQAENYVVDGSHTAIIFGISHLGYSYTYGRFNKVKGSYVLDRANPSRSSFQWQLETASIDSNDAKRDEHLRSPEFFDAKQFPYITFVSKRVIPKKNEKGATIFQVTGDLTIHGVTRQVTLPIQKLGEGKGPYGKYRTGFFCRTSVKRSDYGLTNMLPMVGDNVSIMISFEGILQGSLDASGSKQGSGSATKNATGSGKKAVAGSDKKANGSGSVKK